MRDTTNLIIHFNQENTKGYHPKSKVIIGNMEIYLEKKFNWFNKLIIKWLLGLEVENLDG